MARSPRKGATTTPAPATAPVNLLAEAVKALNANTPFMATEADMAALLKDNRGPLVEYNAAIKDGDKIAFRATPLGSSVYTATQPAVNPTPAGWGPPAGAPAPAPNPAPNPAPATDGAKRGTYKFASNILPPAAARGGRGSTVYGFETMDVNQSFFIPATADNPNPAKRIASTVSSATKRLDPKRFIVRSVTANADMAGQWGVAEGQKGAGIWRTE